MSIKTTGELRQFLTGVLVDVAQGRCDENKAKTITKIAAQVNESFYSEIKVAKVMMEAQKQAAEFGLLAINRIG